MPYRIPKESAQTNQYNQEIVNTEIYVSKNRAEGVLKKIPALYDTKTSTMSIVSDPAFN